jgi:N6-L-threonylcarbamoyladenine synthase
MRVLGIETSCDETAAAVVQNGRTVQSNVVYTQIARHQPYGGVVPEIACRAHVEALPSLVRQALSDAGATWNDIDAVAATYGPGLAGALLVGVGMAEGLAQRLNKPLIGVNHVEAHIYSLFLDSQAPEPGAVCPCLVLMVSGGHTALIRMDRVGRYRMLGQTLDDAAGEALDKGAAVLRLGYPGGPIIEKRAEGGNPHAVKFPRGMEYSDEKTRTFGLDPELCFSFSGLKTALLYYVRSHPEIFSDDAMFRDVVASYQQAVCESLLRRVRNAFAMERFRSLACVGGVARNKVLRAGLEQVAHQHGARLLLAPMAYCTDNAAMVAAVAAAEGAGVKRATDHLDVDPDLRLTGI